MQAAQVPLFLFWGSCRYDGARHVISPLFITNDGSTTFSQPLDSKPSQFSKTHSCPLFLLLSPSDLLLIVSPLLNNARTRPCARSGETPLEASPHLRISTGVPIQVPKVIGQSDTRYVYSSFSFCQPGHPPTICQSRSHPQNRSARSANPAVGHLEVWMAGRWQRCVCPKRLHTSYS